MWWSPAGQEQGEGSSQNGVMEAASTVQILQGMVELGFVCSGTQPGLGSGLFLVHCFRLIHGVMG